MYLNTIIDSDMILKSHSSSNRVYLNIFISQLIFLFKDMRIVSILFVCLSVILTNGLIPNRCVKNFTEPEPKICCPEPFGYLEACGFPYRGECKLLRSVKYAMFVPIQAFQDDIRFKWPLKMFSYFCHCYGHFGGTDCGRCSFGYKGRDCSERTRFIRRNVMSLNDTELMIFRSVLDIAR